MEQTGAVGGASDFGPRGSILVRGAVCCGLEQVTFPQLKMYYMFSVAIKSSIELMFVFDICMRLLIKIIIIVTFQGPSYVLLYILNYENYNI